MRCVILGGRGFLGRHVGRALSSEGHEVWSVDRESESITDPLPWVHGEVRCAYVDIGRWLEKTGHPDCVVHLASSTVPSTASESPICDVNSNLIGTLHLLDGLRDLSVKPRVLFASSGGAVYGRPQATPIVETHPTVPLGAYGVTKLATEHYFRVEEALNGLPVRILRLSNPYGEWQQPRGIQGVVSAFAFKALHRQPVDVWGDGSVIRDFLYAEDVGRAFAAAATHEGGARVFNIGSGEGISVNEVLEALERVLGHEIKRHNLPGRPFDPPVNILDISLAGKELSWKPEVSFDDGLHRLINWLRTV